MVCSSSAPQEQATFAASVLGLASQPVFWWSLYTLKTTGCGLPAGPFGLLGAAEGVSYLVVPPVTRVLTALLPGELKLILDLNNQMLTGKDFARSSKIYLLGDLGKMKSFKKTPQTFCY